MNQVYQFLHNPRDEHLHVVKRTYHYLKGTINMGLRITSINNDQSTIVAYCDSDWGGIPDRCSIISSNLCFGGYILSWSTKK